MDKKGKKRLEVLRKKVTQLQQQLSGATRQMDDAEEVTRLKKELATAEAEIEKIKAG
jgi:peptidoglycan hydrolase CwlO-like protein